MSMASRVGVMSEGRILQVAPPQQIYERPNCRFVADFVGSINLFEGRVSALAADHAVIDTAAASHYVSHGVEASVGMALTLALRPEKINLQSAAPTPAQRATAAEQGYNWAAGEITAIAYFGNETRYQLRLDSGMELSVARSNAGRHDSAQLARSQRVFAWWDGADLVVLAS